MPRTRRTVVAAAAVAFGLVAALAGCDAGPVDPTSSPPPSPAPPIFASDEEALAAAEAAYAAYLSEVDKVTQSGGVDEGELAQFVAPDYLAELVQSLAKLRESGNRTTGSSSYDGMRMLDQPGTTEALVRVYVCLDTSKVRVLGADGEDVTPEKKPTRLPIVASFTSREPGSSVLVPSGSEVWPGDDFC